jgi:hypothetical protein
LPAPENRRRGRSRVWLPSTLAPSSNPARPGRRAVTYARGDVIFSSLLWLARYGKKNAPGWVLPKISRTALAEMGTTRSRVNFFMNKFKKLGFIEYSGSLKINPSLVTVVSIRSSEDTCSCSAEYCPPRTK